MQFSEFPIDADFKITYFNVSNSFYVLRRRYIIFCYYQPTYSSIDKYLNESQALRPPTKPSFLSLQYCVTYEICFFSQFVVIYTCS